MGNDPVSDALHHELCAAIAELAKSVDVAAKRMALRAKFTSAIIDARKAERVAEALRAAAVQNDERAIAPDTTTQNLGRHRETDIIQQLNEACGWLREGATVTSPLTSKKKENRDQSAFAQSLLELHDRTGGFLKSDSHV
jgi:hypothetical protein